MAVIVAEFENIPGESTVTGFEEKVDALAIRESLEVAAAQVSGAVGGARTVGQARHSDIELVRIKDRASPKLAQACSSGENLGEMKINLFRTLEQGLVVFMTYTLSQTFVSRIENDTLDGNGVPYLPHFISTSVIGPSPALGLASVVAPLARGQAHAMRVAPRPAVQGIRGPLGNLEIERVWFNAAQVRWTYTPYTHGVAGGVIEKAWNVQAGVEA